MGVVLTFPAVHKLPATFIIYDCLMIEFSIEKSSSSLLISNFAQKRASEKVDRNQASIYNQADTNQIETCLL